MRLRLAKVDVAGTPDILRSVCSAYLDFAQSRPVIYEAMFVLPTGLKFASEETPAALRAAFAELVAAFGSEREMLDSLAEVLWSALHGMAVLARSGRIPPSGADPRLNVLVRTFGDKATQLSPIVLEASMIPRSTA